METRWGGKALEATLLLNMVKNKDKEDYTTSVAKIFRGTDVA